jgi:hypothetical protein
MLIFSYNIKQESCTAFSVNYLVYTEICRYLPFQ